jgi:hypothetical protein
MCGALLLHVGPWHQRCCTIHQAGAPVCCQAPDPSASLACQCCHYRCTLPPSSARLTCLPACLPQVGRTKAAAAEAGEHAWSKGAYFLGKVLWAKGYTELLERLEEHTAQTGEKVDVDVFGTGPDMHAVQEEAGRRRLPLKFNGAMDHADKQLQVRCTLVLLSRTSCVRCGDWVLLRGCRGQVPVQWCWPGVVLCSASLHRAMDSCCRRGLCCSMVSLHLHNAPSTCSQGPSLHGLTRGLQACS